jgi:hypothetical protein
MALNDEATLFLDDLQHAEEMSAAIQRSWFGRLAERGANLITRLL